MNVLEYVEVLGFVWLILVLTLKRNFLQIYLLFGSLVLLAA